VQWERVSRFRRDSPTQVLDEVRLGAWIQVRSLDRQKMITVYHIRVVRVNGNVVFRGGQAFSAVLREERGEMGVLRPPERRDITAL
jgi:hypothetical protein